MKIVRPCELCNINPATDKHHLYSNSKHARSKYGKLIHDEKNIMYLCNGCHLNKSIPKYSEPEFREVMGLTEKGELEK